MQTEINLKSFAEKVQQMRTLQKNWFRYHSKKDFKESMQMEKEVDDLIKLITHDIPIVQPKNLFL